MFTHRNVYMHMTYAWIPTEHNAIMTLFLVTYLHVTHEMSATCTLHSAHGMHVQATVNKMAPPVKERVHESCNNGFDASAALWRHFLRQYKIRSKSHMEFLEYGSWVKLQTTEDSTRILNVKMTVLSIILFFFTHGADKIVSLYHCAVECFCAGLGFLQYSVLTLREIQLVFSCLDAKSVCLGPWDTLMLPFWDLQL